MAQEGASVDVKRTAETQDAQEVKRDSLKAQTLESAAASSANRFCSASSADSTTNSSPAASTTLDSSSKDGASATTQEHEAFNYSFSSQRSRRNRFGKSLQARIIIIFALVGFICTATMGILSYLRISDITTKFVDEELSQIASVAINYHMIIPRRWEAPRHNHERVIRVIRRNGKIIMQYATPSQGWRNAQSQGFGVRRQQLQSQGSSDATNNSQGSIQPRTGSLGSRQIITEEQSRERMRVQSQQALQGALRPFEEEPTPSIFDLHKFNYDIIIAPLYGRPGDALYIPPGVGDGFYTVLVADQRVRAFVSTNTEGQRFVVARPLSSLDTITDQALTASLLQFIIINLVFIPILIISVRLMFKTLNLIAKSLYKRSEDDLSPVIPDNHVGYVPSELDGFIISLNRLFSRVDEGIQSKRRFIADAAHEMRTPLTALSLQAEALEKEELSPSARRKVERLKDGIARERELMTSLLTLAREQSRRDVKAETIEIMQLFTKLIDEQGVLADRKFIDLGVEGNADYKLVTDRMRINQIMSNLVSNAIKYTPEDGRVDLMVEPLADGALRLIVQDDGPGIPDEHLRHILEPFYRVDGDRSEIQGTGLGLAIVKASCDSIQAKLSFENVSPHGLKASVELPPLNKVQGGF